MRLEQIAFEDDLTARFTVSKADLKRLHVRAGDTLELIQSGGMPDLFSALRRWRLLSFTVLFLGACSLYLSGRILFISVEGNGNVPARLILERAEECGVYFGASGRALRSEQVKNNLLWAIPELRWAGVNLQGCSAVITVAERDSGAMEERGAGDLVASVDAMVTAVLPQAGTASVVPGQAVRKGDILISGATDVGLCTRIDRAAGEVYGLTRRELTAVLPQNSLQRVPTGESIRKFSLRIGKKSVNFSNDSGILHGTCVKMRTVNYLTLPGGFRLPVALVTDTYFLSETEEAEREDTEALLSRELRGHVQRRMTAGIIHREERRFDGGKLTAVYECQEMIGVFRPGIYTEGDWNDRQNRERGAG
ncbi:MAG: sporulation protein YqfD [Oscillospiraceae bacterium]|nr:sporulation protein YqfD [Oscillospiraceae bacterium]